MIGLQQRECPIFFTHSSGRSKHLLNWLSLFQFTVQLWYNGIFPVVYGNRVSHTPDDVFIGTVSNSQMAILQEFHEHSLAASC